MTVSRAIAGGLALAFAALVLIAPAPVGAQEDALPFDRKLDGWRSDTLAQQREASLRCYALTSYGRAKIPADDVRRTALFEAMHRFMKRAALLSFGADPERPGEQLNEVNRGASFMMRRYGVNNSQGVTLGFQDVNALMQDDFRFCYEQFKGVIEAMREGRDDG